jgi:predicted metal-binding membrane protein
MLIAAALAFVASAAVTLAWCASMASMPGMEMPGDWTMSMAFMRMPGQRWPEAAATFVCMWVVMMIPMMLPALLPELLRERKAGQPPIALAVGYFAAWSAAGVALFPVGAVLAHLAMSHVDVARLAPYAAGVLLIVAGALQSGAWKARALRRCRVGDGCCTAPGAAGWRSGFALGVSCVRCCAPWTAVLLVLGVMDLAAMALTTAAISLERLLTRGERVARIGGLAMIAAGTLVLTSQPG